MIGVPLQMGGVGILVIYAVGKGLTVREIVFEKTLHPGAFALYVPAAFAVNILLVESGINVPLWYHKYPLAAAGLEESITESPAHNLTMLPLMITPGAG